MIKWDDLDEIVDLEHINELIKKAARRNPKPKKRYLVYEVFTGDLIGITDAVSEEKAVNNVRWNRDGLYGYNEDYYAVEIEEELLK